MTFKEATAKLDYIIKLRKELAEVLEQNNEAYICVCEGRLELRFDFYEDGEAIVAFSDQDVISADTLVKIN